MGGKLFLLFNHRLTDEQKRDARESLGINDFIHPPADLTDRWSQIPSDIPELDRYLKPIRQWLSDEAATSDYVLIQGDFGATFLMVNFAFDTGLMPVYATTVREAIEQRAEDGNVKMTHVFRHRRFRRYEKKLAGENDLTRS